MYRPIVILSVATVALAAPLAAQGHSGKQTRTYIDSRGRECRETRHLKGNGDEQYQVKCKNPKGHRDWQRDDRDDDDRDEDDRGAASHARHDRNGGYDSNGRYDRNGGYGVPTQCLDTRQRCSTVGSGYPSTLPDMASAVIWGRGQRTSSATRWLGGNDYRVRYIDRDRDGRPEVASWFGGDGRMIQQWVDTNRDGRADAVRFYRRGQLVRQLGG
ncbi:MAG: hypothetical protein ACJ79K_01800 [Gemmatimonadaceae bacterium]